jgi:hypothetical protein
MGERQLSGKPVEMREADFIRSVNAYIKYPKDLREAFISYWSEPNKSGSKMRFELEKTWDTGRRLGTWDRNNFGNKAKPPGGLAPVIHIESRKPAQNEPPGPANDIERLEQVLGWYKNNPAKWSRKALQEWPHLVECSDMVKKYRLWDQTITKQDIERVKAESSAESYLRAYILHRTFEWYGTTGWVFSDTLNARK